MMDMDRKDPVILSPADVAYGYHNVNFHEREFFRALPGFQR